MVTTKRAETDETAERAATMIGDGDPTKRYLVPGDDEFRSAWGSKTDYIDAADLIGQGAALIAAYPELTHLAAETIVYLWRRAGGATKGGATLGKCARVSGLLGAFTDAGWVVWLAADHCRDRAFTRRQVEALLFHELLHIGKGESDAPALVGHDFEGFRAELARYGSWRDDLRDLRRTVAQLPLFEAAPEATI